MGKDMSWKFRVIFSVVVISVGISGWWVFHFPFRAELVYRVIPEDATAGSRHISPALRINALCDSSVITNVAGVLGPDGDDLLDTLDDYWTRKLVNVIGSKLVVTAFVPSMGGFGQPEYVFGGWIGGYSQLLRWGVLDRYLTDFSVHHFSGNRRVWVCACPEIGAGYYLSLAVHEGMLMGCLSTDKVGVLYLLQRLNGQKSLTGFARKLQESEEADAFRVSLLAEKGGNSIISGGVSEVSSDQIIAEVEFDGKLSEDLQKYFPENGIAKDRKGSGSLLGDSPSLLAEIPVSSISPIIRDAGIDELQVWKKIEKYFKHDSSATIFASGGNYYGRIMGMKVPSLGLRLPLAVGKDGSQTINSIMDELNAEWQYGLIATVDKHDKRIRTINSVRNGAFKALRRNERPAIAICDGELLCMSNVNVLRKILSEYDDAGASDVLSKHPGDSIYWASDLEETGDLLLKALAGYTLVSLLQKNGRHRYDTAQLKQAIRVLGELEQLIVWGNFTEPTPKLHIQLRY